MYIVIVFDVHAVCFLLYCYPIILVYIINVVFRFLFSMYVVLVVFFLSELSYFMLTIR